MAIWTMAKKEWRLLARDRLSAVILLAMPLVFILVLGLLLGEGFGQKTDNRLRVSLVIEDAGYPTLHAAAPLASVLGNPLAGVSLTEAVASLEPWSQVVQRDLGETSEIKVEIIPSLEEAERLVREGRRAAVLVLGPRFSERVQVCSFLADGINPFYRDGVNLAEIDARLIKDRTQLTSSAIIEQVGQVTLLRVILPWMIGKAFDRLSDPAFIDLLGKEVNLPVPSQFRLILGKERMSLKELLERAAGGDPEKAADFRGRVGAGVKKALQEQFSKYNLTSKTWADLTKSDPRLSGVEATRFRETEGSGWLKRGAARYQLLVPSYTVLFAYALVLTVGWMFVMERRQGTVKRLKAAPVTRGEVLAGKFLPCFAVSLLQGALLLIAGRLLFGMSWGPPEWSLGRQVLTLTPVVVCTSLAAMGLAMLLATLARTEIQVALVGALVVLVPGLLSGCLIPRELLPEAMLEVSRWTPHFWSLEAYRQLLVPAEPGSAWTPDLERVWQACLVLTGFGTAFLALAWVTLRLD